MAIIKMLRGVRDKVNSSSARPLLTPWISAIRNSSSSPQCNASDSLSSHDYMELESTHSAHNYHPIKAVFSRAKDVKVWDPEGREYIDFLSAYSAANQGHCHPKVINALKEQADTLTLSSRAFYNDKFPLFAKKLSDIFKYDMVLPMNTGAEGVETALKLARKWGYEKKGIGKDKAIIVSCCGCFHGRTLSVISMSCDNEAVGGFGPLMSGLPKVDYGDAHSLAAFFKEHGENVAGFLFEPIQGEAGVIIPPDGYLKRVRQLCSQHNVLMIADEIQTGLARTGKMLACDWEDVRPDVLILGKALGAGVLPVSAVLADKDIMLCIRPGEHGSTFGGNPLASAVGIAALDVIQEEKLAEKASSLGEELRGLLQELQKAYPSLIKEVRGRGLLNAIEMDPAGLKGSSAYDVCLSLKEKGILAKPTHDTIIRLSPPLTIRSSHLQAATKALQDVLEEVTRNTNKRSANLHDVKIPCHRCGRCI
ncbi:hypothetical protein KP509_29G037300 [Ceratopteris richardii]|uniref:Ornithine aminotransferase n=1 Tax=Ceratopteris richardii TaxID=49495 RepID=A0A8T2R664_CERRI|nr:hypothetical protein KP509_29G037300 [Ceratopteris richardii]KAH7291830.1 hypothetical protein KP509_29G037300 [Ceratopteris richardii]